MKDLFGTEIKVGDTIAYAILTGRSATMAVYFVLEVLPGKLRVKQTRRGHTYNGRVNEKPSLISMPENRAVVLP